MASGLPVLGRKSKALSASATVEDVPLLARHPLASDAQNFLQPATVAESQLGTTPGAVRLHDLNVVDEEEVQPLLLDTSRLEAAPAAASALHPKPVQATAIHVSAAQVPAVHSIPAVPVAAEPASEVSLLPTLLSASSQLRTAEGHHALTGSDGMAEPWQHHGSDGSRGLMRPSSSDGGGPSLQPQRQASREMSQGSNDGAEFDGEGGGGAQARAATGGHDPGSGVTGGNGTDSAPLGDSQLLSQPSEAPLRDSQLLSQPSEPGPSPEAPFRYSQLVHIRKA